MSSAHKIVDTPANGDAADHSAVQVAEPIPMPGDSETQGEAQERTLEDQVNHLKDKLGKQGNEIGELRKMNADLMSRPTQPQEALGDVDFFDDPEKAIEAKLAEKLKPYQEHMETLKHQQTAAELAAKHPDFADVVASDEFAEWVSESELRQEFFSRANAYDLRAADTLLSDFKAGNAVAQSKSARKTALDAAGTESGAAAEPSKRIYNRQDIIKKQMDDPEWYRNNQAEIMRAYSEGRVK